MNLLDKFLDTLSGSQETRINRDWIIASYRRIKRIAQIRLSKCALAQNLKSGFDENVGTSARILQMKEITYLDASSRSLGDCSSRMFLDTTMAFETLVGRRGRRASRNGSSNECRLTERDGFGYRIPRDAQTGWSISPGRVNWYSGRPLSDSTLPTFVSARKSRIRARDGREKSALRTRSTATH